MQPPEQDDCQYPAAAYDEGGKHFEQDFQELIHSAIQRAMQKTAKITM